MSAFEVGDIVVSVTDEERIPWEVTRVDGDWVTAEVIHRHPGHIPVIGIYRTSTWEHA